MLAIAGREERHVQDVQEMILHIVCIVYANIQYVVFFVLAENIFLIRF
jgi:hypothetical protein